MRILVIGGTGFIGPYAVRDLTAMGHEVTVVHRGQHEADLPREVRHLHHQGLPDRQVAFADLSAEFTRLAPNVVLDMIPATEQDARVLMALFKGITDHVVAISSQDVYRAYGRFQGTEPGYPDPVPLTEDSPLRQRFYPYRGATPRTQDEAQRRMDDYDKILVERTVMDDRTLPGTILRLPAVYGPGDFQHRLFKYLKRMDDKRPVIVLDAGIAQWRWTRGYVENVAAAIALALTDERSAGRIYNVGEAEALTEAEWVRRIGQAAGWDGEIVAIPERDTPPQRASRWNTDQHLVGDSSRIRKELGYTEPVSQVEALKRTVEWERVHPPEKIDPKMFDYAAEDAIVASSERERG